MGAVGRVREWRREQGWGVLDSDQTPGGCWVHFSVVEMRGFRELHADQEVEFEWEHARQDGYRYRAVAVWPAGEAPPPGTGPGVTGTSAFWSYVVIDGVVDTRDHGDEGNGSGAQPDEHEGEA